MIGLQTLATNKDIPETLGNLNRITGDLARYTSQLSQTMNNLNQNVPTITGNLASATEDIAATTAKFKEIDLASIDATLKNIENMSAKLHSKDNSVGLLLNDRQLYDSINSTLNNASLLLKDVRENPQRYINVKVF